MQLTGVGEAHFRCSAAAENVLYNHANNARKDRQLRHVCAQRLKFIYFSPGHRGRRSSSSAWHDHYAQSNTCIARSPKWYSHDGSTFRVEDCIQISSSANLPFQILNANLFPSLLIIVEPYPFLQIDTWKDRWRF